jgi:hypothetical protein
MRPRALPSYADELDRAEGRRPLGKDELTGLDSDLVIAGAKSVEDIDELPPRSGGGRAPLPPALFDGTPRKVAFATKAEAKRFAQNFSVAARKRGRRPATRLQGSDAFVQAKA